MDPSLGDLVRKGARPSEDVMARAQERIIKNLADIDTIRQQLAPRRDFYEAQTNELALLQYQLAERGRIARVMPVYWMRSHSNLAAGLTIPPHLSISGILETEAKRAVNTVKP
jgi:hypothetical protein